MRLTSIAIEGQTALPRHITLPPGGACVIHAPNGPLTTTLVEAVAAAKERIGPYGVGGSVLWPTGRPRLEVTLGLTLTEEEIEFSAADGGAIEVSCAIGGPEGANAPPIAPGAAALFKRTHRGKGTFELIPAERSLIGSPPGGGIPGRIADMLRLSTHVKKYAGLPRLLIEAARDAAPSFDAFRRAFDVLSPVTKTLGLRRRGDTAELLFQRGRAPVTFAELGLDEHQYVLFAGLHAIRTFEHSVILFDAPELHLSEAGARALAERIPDLLGHHNQVVFATRSLAIAGAFPASHVLRIE
ncbi:MAG: hypothetical protein HOV80_30970 [Polyangiaceae bacterium]|nr:hypothetical protein [Polyangiaceae bacterium]